MFSQKEQKEQIDAINSPWTEDPLVAYKNFLNYAEQRVNDEVKFNRQMLTFFGASHTTEKEKELKVYAYNGKFYPLSTMLSLNGYCSKVTIRNIERAMLIFNFKNNIISRVLGIEAGEREGKDIQIAYRNIVPSEFSQATQLAGPMGFHEFMIDGSKTNIKKTSLIQFFANSDFNATPIKIVLENCKGFCFVEGLDIDAFSRVFDNKCNEDDFKLNRREPSQNKLG